MIYPLPWMKRWSEWRNFALDKPRVWETRARVTCQPELCDVSWLENEENDCIAPFWTRKLVFFCIFSIFIIQSIQVWKFLRDNIVVIKKRFLKVWLYPIKICLQDVDCEGKHFKNELSNLLYEAIFIYIGNLQISVNLLSITKIFSAIPTVRILL